MTVGVTSYNSAGTIRRCLDSVLQQSLGASRMELIVVDDGSDDDTLTQVRSYRSAANWSGFRAVRQRATGNASTGRNEILTRAAGKYVLFLDADDYLGEQALETMAATARRHRADIVTGRYVGVGRSAPNVLGAEEHPTVHPYHPGWLNSLHIQKLFSVEFLRGLNYRFNPRLNYANDHPFMLNAFLHAQRTAFVHDVDCYFITLAAEGPGHISRARLSAAEQLRFLHDCFGLLALARGQGGEMARLAGRMRADYWNRLLKLHLPMLILRKSDPEEAAELAHAAANLAEIYGARTSRARLAPGAETMLSALNEPDGQRIMDVAEQVRAEVRGEDPAG